MTPEALQLKDVFVANPELGVQATWSLTTALHAVTNALYSSIMLLLNFFTQPATIGILVAIGLVVFWYRWVVSRIKKNV